MLKLFTNQERFSDNVSEELFKPIDGHNNYNSLAYFELNPLIGRYDYFLQPVYKENIKKIISDHSKIEFIKNSYKNCVKMDAQCWVHKSVPYIGNYSSRRYLNIGNWRIMNAYLISMNGLGNTNPNIMVKSCRMVENDGIYNFVAHSQHYIVLFETIEKSPKYHWAYYYGTLGRNSEGRGAAQDVTYEIEETVVEKFV